MLGNLTLREYLLPLFQIAVALSCPLAAVAGGPAYTFRGYFAAQDRVPVSVNARTPVDLVDRSFTISIFWPEASTSYSSDQQPGASGLGSYSTTDIALEIDVPGFDFTVPPSINSWESRNDTVLDYYQGIPQTSGDELRLNTRAIWNQSYNLSVISDPFDNEPEVSTEYLVSLRAANYSDENLDDISLQTHFDLSDFEDVWFEFREVVPVSGNSFQMVFNQWQGVVESYSSIPEPKTIVSVIITLFVVLGRFPTRCPQALLSPPHLPRKSG